MVLSNCCIYDQISTILLSNPTNLEDETGFHDIVTSEPAPPETIDDSNHDDDDDDEHFLVWEAGKKCFEELLLTNSNERFSSSEEVHEFYPRDELRTAITDINMQNCMYSIVFSFNECTSETRPRMIM